MFGVVVCVVVGFFEGVGEVDDGLFEVFFE